MKKTVFTLKTLFIILIIILLTYAIMAVITHFSLHYKLPGYKFSQSLVSIFDSSTDIFLFFSWFMIINIVWISAAIIIRTFIKLIKE